MLSSYNKLLCIQEKLNTILPILITNWRAKMKIINEFINENINECIGKLIAI